MSAIKAAVPNQVESALEGEASTDEVSLAS